MADPAPIPPRVFISYSHDSDEHAARVLAFANSLVDKGVDVLLDRYTPVPPEGWPHWMEDSLDAAGFVLMVCTETYLQRVMQREKPGVGLGVRWEGNLIYNRLYGQEPQGQKYLPVLFQAADAAFIPGPTQGHTRFLIQGFDLSDPQYEALYRYLTGQPATPKPELGGLVVLSPLPRQVHPVPAEGLWAKGLWMVPYARNPFFTAREDALAGLQAALASGQAAAVTGLGGIGKTQTAVEYAYRHRDEYRYVLWAGAADDTALREGFAEIARRLGLPQAQEKDQSLAVAAVQAWLEETEGWLLILDNADDLSQANAFLPVQRRGHVLLTTRAAATGAVARAVPITDLSAGDGALLLLRRAKRVAGDVPLESATPEDRDAALALAQEVDGLPLALDQAGAYIEETPSSPARYLSLYRDQAADLLGEYGDEPRAHPSVSVTYSLAFAKVAAADPAAGEMVRCCAFLGPDAIPEEIFTGGEAALNVVPGPFGAKGLAWDKMVREACRYSLLSRDPDGGSLSIHRLVQTVTRHGLDEAARRAYAERLVRAVNLAFPHIEFSDWPFCERLLPHAQVCAEHIHTYGLETEDAGRLLHQVGFYLIERAQYAVAEPLYEQARVISEKVLGPGHPDAIISLSNLANLYETQGKYAQAGPLFKQALSISRKALGPEHPVTVIVLNSLASLYYAQGEYEAAEPLYKRALSIREKALRSEHPGTPGTLNDLARSLNNLGNLYRTQGRFAEAKPLLERATETLEKALGPEHPDIARSLSNLAALYQAQGDAPAALRLYERAGMIFEKSLGPEHPDTATNLNNQANLYHAQNRYADAEPLLKRVLAIFEKVQGPEHPDTAAALNNLAALYYDEDKYAEAQPLYERSLAISEKARGPEHPDTARSLSNLAILYDAQGKSADAEPLLKRALAIFEKALGPEHPDTIGARQTYADLLAKISK